MRWTKKSMLSIFFTIIILVFLVIRIVFFPVKVTGVSMYPTYDDGEVINSSVFFNRDDIKRGTVITFYEKNSRKIYVKRVIGVPGDTVQIVNGKTYINGEEYKDDFNKMDNAGIAKDPITIKDGEYFVLGDNRNNSIDSRVIGVINSKVIISKIKK